MSISYLYALSLDSLQLLLDVSEFLLLSLDVGLDQSGPLLQLLLQVLHGVHLRRELHHRLWVERKRTGHLLQQYQLCAVTHALVFIKKDWQLHGRAAAKDDFYYLLVCYFPQSLYKIAENSEKYQITISQST